jgi:hypothetical protein
MSREGGGGGKGGRYVGLTTLIPSGAGFLESREPEPPGTSGPVQAYTEIALPYLHINYVTYIHCFLCQISNKYILYYSN